MTEQLNNTNNIYIYKFSYIYLSMETWSLMNLELSEKNTLKSNRKGIWINVNSD